MPDILPFLQELGFWIFFIFLLYVFFVKPRVDRKNEELLQKDIQAGDDILTYKGIIGKVISVRNEKICFSSGSKDEHFTIEAGQLKKNYTQKLRRKNYLKSLPILTRIKAVL